MNPSFRPVVQSDLSRRDLAVRLGGGGIAALFMTAATLQSGSAQEATYQAGPTQEATSPPDTGAVGVAMQLMGSGQPATVPGMELTLRRTTLLTGGRLPAHSHPGALVIFVEEGAFGYTALGGMAQLTRASSEGTPDAAEVMPVGTEVILNPGDWLFVEDPQDDIRNAGEDHVVLIVAGLTPIGEPFTTFL